MGIPDFLRPGSSKPSEKDIEMKCLSEKYKESFNEYPTTEPSTYNTEEWINILGKCIKEKVKVNDLLKGELETGDTYCCAPPSLTSC